MTPTHSTDIWSQKSVQPKPILSPQALDTLHQCWATSGLSGTSCDCRTQPLTGDSPCTGTEDGEENRVPGIKDSLSSSTKPQQAPRAHPEAGSPQDSRDPEEAVSGLVPPPSSPSCVWVLRPLCEQGRDQGLCGSPEG